MAQGEERVLPTVWATWGTQDDEDAGGDEAEPEPTGRYTEVGPIGRGGLGEVVEVRDADLRRIVALKRPLAAPTSAQVRALVREAQITAQLAHPGIPSVHALGIDDQGRPYFTMARIHGRTLADVLAGGPLPSQRAVRWFVPVAWAVAYGHQHGVVHRDLKPANILVGEFGDVYVLDWGISRVIGDPHDPSCVSVSTPDAGHSRVEGTPGYAAPEQLRGEGGDARTDVYALGALLFELLQGHPPVDVTDPTLARDATLHGRLREWHGSPPPALAAIARRALATEPADRYPDVAAMLADIEAWQDGYTVAAYAEDPLHHFGRFYLSRSPGLRRLRWVDVDLWCLAATLFGIALAGWFPGWVDPRLAMVCCFVAFVPPMARVLRPGDDELADDDRPA